MLGGGVRADNVLRLIEATGAGDVHFSAGVTRESAMRHRNARCSMGAEKLPGEYERRLTDEARVREIVLAARRRA